MGLQLGLELSVVQVNYLDGAKHTGMESIRTPHITQLKCL